MPDYRIESWVLCQAKDIEQQWLDLQERSHCSYFQSWGWISTWLEQIAIRLQPIAVGMWLDDKLIGLGLFVPASIRRHHIIHSKALFLNEYPLNNNNMVIEYNGILAQRGLERTVYREIVGYLAKKYESYEEFHFGAVADDVSLESLKTSANESLAFLISDELTSWQVDLDGLSPGLDGYLASLSNNRRWQVRRSLRLYQDQGSLRLEVARTAEEALGFLDELKILHTERWRARGKEGAFGNPQWERFHRALIRGRFEQGEIQILKVSNSQSTLGYLYNFVWRKNVYVLQSGFRLSTDKRLKPGYVIHSLTVAHNKGKGLSVYDLMYGDSRYKKSICNRSRRVYWVVLQRHRLKFGFERLMVGLVRRSRNIISKK